MRLAFSSRTPFGACPETLRGEATLALVAASLLVMEGFFEHL